MNVCTNCGQKLSGVKFCGNCGSPASETNKGLENSPDELISWAGRYHANAMNYLFERSYENDDAFFEDFENRLDGSFAQASSCEDPNTLLEYAMANCLYRDTSGRRLALAEKALGLAQEAGLPLGRFKYALGQVMETEQMREEAIDSYLESLSLGFGHAAFNIGLLHLDDKEFGSAIRAWIRGRDEFGDSDCLAQLKQLEVAPGEYTLEIELEDGSIELVAYSENPGGFGKLINE